MPENSNHYTIESANKVIAQNAAAHKSETYRLNYHLTPPCGWMNDPNGLIQFNGVYHAFYQFYPYAPEWGPMHWGHAISRDLVHWEHQPVALAPDQEYENGCFSGSAVNNNGVLTLIYTAHHDSKSPKELQCVATSRDGIHFDKPIENPVIATLPPDTSEDFRDPKVRTENGRWRMVVGCGKDGIGRALSFESADLLHWEYKGVLCESDGKMGELWECPDFFTIGKERVLMFSPIRMPGHKAVFATGDFDEATGRFRPKALREVDYGDDFYAPQTFEDENGRRILIGWMDMWNRSYPTRDENWAGAFTLPREVIIKDGSIFTPPVAEAALLRGKKLIDNSFTLIKNSAANIDEVCGDSLEIKCTLQFDKESCREFKMKLRASKDGSEETLLIYDPATGKLTIDKTKSGIQTGGSGISSAELKLNRQKELSLDIFIDRCSVEVFANDGEAVVSERIYPSKESIYCDLTTSGGDCTVKNISAWELG